jgi:hypothetical protein
MAMGDKGLVHSAAAIMAAPMTAPKGSDAAKNGDRLYIYFSERIEKIVTFRRAANIR